MKEKKNNPAPPAEQAKETASPTLPERLGQRILKLEQAATGIERRAQQQLGVA